LECISFLYALSLQIPIVEDELRKASGEKTEEETTSSVTVQKLVTSDGTYASQSAFNISRFDTELKINSLVLIYYICNTVRPRVERHALL
jgi:hypothetical protein